MSEVEEKSEPEPIYLYKGKPVQSIITPFLEGYAPTFAAQPKVVSLEKLQFVWRGPKIPFSLYSKMVAFFRKIQKLHDSECQVRFFFNPNTLIWDIHAFPQQGLGMSTIEINGEQFDQQRATWPEPWFGFGTGHHHCKAGAFQSGIDKADEENTDGLHITLGNVDKEQMSFHGRLVFCGETHQAEMCDWFAPPDNVTQQVEPLLEAGLLDREHLLEIYKRTLLRHNPDEGIIPKLWMDNFSKAKPSYLPRGPYLSGNYFDRKWGYALSRNADLHTPHHPVSTTPLFKNIQEILQQAEAVKKETIQNTAAILVEVLLREVTMHPNELAVLLTAALRWPQYQGQASEEELMDQCIKEAKSWGDHSLDIPYEDTLLSLPLVYRKMMNALSELLETAQETSLFCKCLNKEAADQNNPVVVWCSGPHKDKPIKSLFSLIQTQKNRFDIEYFTVNCTIGAESFHTSKVIKNRETLKDTLISLVADLESNKESTLSDYFNNLSLRDAGGVVNQTTVSGFFDLLYAHAIPKPDQCKTYSEALYSALATLGALTLTRENLENLVELFNLYFLDVELMCVDSEPFTRREHILSLCIQEQPGSDDEWDEYTERSDTFYY